MYEIRIDLGLSLAKETDFLGRKPLPGCDFVLNIRVQGHLEGDRFLRDLVGHAQCPGSDFLRHEFSDLLSITMFSMCD